MTCYEDSPRTTYVGAKIIVRGFAAIRAQYAARYTPGQMGRLYTSDLETRGLGPDYAVAVARWHLVRSRSAGGNASGLFTLVLHRNRAGWRIVVDHSPRKRSAPRAAHPRCDAVVRDILPG
jgi:ketosteroid isomerase-like protein